MPQPTFQILFFFYVILSFVSCNIWDNIFSQTEASYPIILSESFNIDLTLPQNLKLDGNVDFNSQLKILTLTLSKKILTQKLDFIKAQIDLSQLLLNVDQFLLGCEKFTLGLQEQANGNVKKTINGVNLSKKQLFLANLLFKYIGKYDLKKQGSIDGYHKKDDFEAGILDIFKGNSIFDSIAGSGVFGDIKKDKLEGINERPLNMFEFSIDFYRDPNKIIEQIKKAKDVAGKDFQIDDEIKDFNLEDFDWDIIKFVILADGKTGEIVKAFKNKDMEEKLEFSLKSKETNKVQCKKQAKKLTIEDLTNGAKYIYENKDSFEDFLD